MIRYLFLNIKGGMDQFEQLPSNSNEVCSSSASASASASSPSPTIPITQPQAQTPSQHSGLPPLPHSGPKREKSEVWDHFEKYEEVVESVKEDGSKYATTKKRDRCKYCSISYTADSIRNWTSNLRKHIENLCKKYPGVGGGRGGGVGGS